MAKFKEPFHQSDIGTYLTCPHSFYLRRVLNFPESYRHPAAIAGSTIHWAIDNWHKNGQHPLSEIKAHSVIADLWDETIKGNDPMTIAHQTGELPPVNWNLGKESQYDLINNAVIAFYNYTNTPHNIEAELVHSELSFTVNIYNNIFAGSIDQIRANSQGGLELWDLKFSKSIPSQLYLDRSNQFTIYAYAMSKGFFYQTEDKSELLIYIGEYPQKIVWYHLRNLIPYKRNYKQFKAGDFRGDPRIYTFRSEQQIKNQLKDVRKICTLIKRGDHPRAPRETGSCNGFCRFHDACMNGLEKLPLDFKRDSAAQALEEFI